MFINIDTANYMGTANITAHNSLIAVVVDEEVNMDIDDDEPRGIDIYDAQNLNLIETKEQSGWGVTLAGPPGEETFITNNANLIEISHPADDDDDMDDAERQLFRFPNSSADGIPSIGSETHVLFLAGNLLNLNKLPNAANEDLILCQSALLGREHRNDDEGFRNLIAWGQCRSEFVVYHAVGDVMSDVYDESEISIWTVDVENDRMVQTQTISIHINLSAISLTDDYVIGACVRRKIHVWNRTTGSKMWYNGVDSLCDVREWQLLDEDEFLYGLQMSCHGHILVTTSHLGCALCIWNIRTGELLRKWDDALEQNCVELLPDGMDVSSMTYWKHLNGFICVCGYLNAWCFPKNQSQRDAAEAIFRDFQEAADLEED